MQVSEHRTKWGHATFILHSISVTSAVTWTLIYPGTRSLLISKHFRAHEFKSYIALFLNELLSS